MKLFPKLVIKTYQALVNLILQHEPPLGFVKLGNRNRFNENDDKSLRQHASTQQMTMNETNVT